MASKVVEIIREYVLQTLAQQGSIPFRITQAQFRAATDSVVECLDSASTNRDASPRVIQREATLLALQTIPRAIAEASKQLDDVPSPPPTGPPDTDPVDNETSIEDLVQKELARRKEQDSDMGVTPPTQTDNHLSLQTQEHTSIISETQPTHTSTPQLPDTHPAVPPSRYIPTDNTVQQSPPSYVSTQIDNQPANQPASQPINRPVSQPANQPNNTPSYTVAVPHNPDETSPIRIRYTPSQPQRTIRVDRVIMPVWVRGEDTPFVVCSVMGTDIFLFPSSSDSHILLPRPHQLPVNSTMNEMIFTFRTPDGELIGTDFERTNLITINSSSDPGVVVSPSIRNTLSGVRIKFKDEEEYGQRVYPFHKTSQDVIEVPLPENEAPIESALGNLRSPWAVSLFLTY